MARIARFRFPVRVWPSGNCQSADASAAVSQLPKREPSLRTPLTRMDACGRLGLNNNVCRYAARGQVIDSRFFIHLPGIDRSEALMSDSGLLAPIDIELPHNGTSSETICRNAYRARAKMTAIHRNRAQPAPGSERQRHL
jgi:hypothetical protein